jgi:hypothetical protein
VTTRERYDAFVRKEVGGWLRELGFKRERNRFGRRVDRAWEIVDFQASVWGSRDEVSFTINLGVGLDEVDSSWDRPRPPAIAGTMLHTRIGALIDDGNDRWWDVRERTDLDKLAGKIRRLLEREALPWLERRSDRDSLRDLLLADETELNSASIDGRAPVRQALGLPNPD